MLYTSIFNNIFLFIDNVKTLTTIKTDVYNNQQISSDLNTYRHKYYL